MNPRFMLLFICNCLLDVYRYWDLISVCWKLVEREISVDISHKCFKFCSGPRLSDQVLVFHLSIRITFFVDANSKVDHYNQILSILTLFLLSFKKKKKIIGSLQFIAYFDRPPDQSSLF